MRRRLTFLLVAMLMPPIAPLAGAAGADPGDVTGSDVIAGTVTWTGKVVRERHATVMPGSTLRIHNATVTFNATAAEFGIEVLPGGNLVIHDTTTRAYGPGLTDLELVQRSWELRIRGNADIARSELRHASSVIIDAGADFVAIRDSVLPWMSRGVQILRQNMTRGEAWDVVMENVTISDVSVGPRGSSAEPPLGGIGGAIGIIGANVLLRDVTVERARAAGFFVDRSSLTLNTREFGNRVYAENLVVHAAPVPGVSGVGVLADIRHYGSFECHRCTFAAHEPSGFALAEGGAVLDDVVISNSPVYLRMSEGTDSLDVSGLRLIGPRAYLDVQYSNSLNANLTGTSFDLQSPTGVLSPGEYPISMRGVWWGDPSGPLDADEADGSTPITNAGAGRLVSGPVDYSGWLTAPPESPRPLRLSHAAPPSLVPAGSLVTYPVTVTNAGDEPTDVALRLYSGAGATLSPSTMSLAPGASGIVTVRVPVLATVAPGALLLTTLIAEADGVTDIASLPVRVGVGAERPKVDSPTPLQTVQGAFTIRGRVLVPDPLPPNVEPLPSAPSGPAGLLAHDADGDRIDDRIGGAPGRAAVLIDHAPGARPAVTAAIEASGGQVGRAFSLVPTIWAVIDPARADELLDAGATAIRWDEPTDLALATGVRAARARTSTEGVLPGGGEPGVDYAGVWRGNPQAGYEGPTGRGVLVAVIDSGIDPTHNSIDDLDDDPATTDLKIVDHIATAGVFQVEGQRVAPSVAYTPGSHGTAVAGTVAGTGAGFLGPADAPLHVSTPEDRWLHAGAAPGARILDVDAYEELPVGGYNLVPGVAVVPNGVGLAIEGFEAVSTWNLRHPDDPVRVVQISLSLGSADAEHPVNKAADALAEQGVLVVVAAGNLGTFVPAPASARKVMAVGASDDKETVNRLDDTVARYSNGVNAAQHAAGLRKPEIIAPGTDIILPAYTTGDGYRESSGTSFAAPIVSGVAALVFEVNPDLHPAQVKEILIRSSEPRGLGVGAAYTDVDLDFEDDLLDGGWDARWGYGYLDAEEAVRLARDTLPRAPPRPDVITLHAAGSTSLSEEEPVDTAVVVPPGAWSMTPTLSLRLGDTDPATVDTGVVIVQSPLATLEPALTTVVARLRVGGTLVAETTHVDNTIRTSTLREMRVTLAVGHRATLNESGADAGNLMVRESLGVLDANGNLALPAGAPIRLELDVTHSGAPGPVLAGPGGTRVLLPLDKSSLPDGVPPGAPGGITADWDATSVHLSWGPAYDDVGISGYAVLRDGEAIATVGASTFALTDTAVAAGTSYRYAVRALDLRENVGPMGDVISVVLPPATGRALIVDAAGTSALATDLAGDGTFRSWAADLTPARAGRTAARATLFEDGATTLVDSVPFTVTRLANRAPSIQLPTIDGILHGRRDVAFSASDPDAGDVLTVEARVDGGAWSPADGGAFTLEAARVGPGAHTLEMRVTDQDGAQASASRAFEAKPWDATMPAPQVLAESEPLTLALTLVGDGAETAAPRLVLGGLVAGDVPFGPSGDGWTVSLLPFGASGLVTLEVRHGEDALLETAILVDRAPTALVAGRAAGTRLEEIVLQDLSFDDEGIASRAWTLPNGTTASGPTLRIAPFDLPVGASAVALTVTNVNGLSSATLHHIAVANLPPSVQVGPFQLGTATVSTAFTGEPLRVRVAISDPENDPLVIDGNLTVDGAPIALAPGAQTLAFTPEQAGLVVLAAAVRDPYVAAAPVVRTLVVEQNVPPEASLTAPDVVDAGSTFVIDGSASRDTGRPLAARRIEVVGFGEFDGTTAQLALPMGKWTVRMHVTDTSGATAVAERAVKSDDWLTAAPRLLSQPTLAQTAAVVVPVRWHDGLPAEGATVTLTVRHSLLPADTARTYTAVTDDAGSVTFMLPRDTPFGNLPGPHEVAVIVQHAGRAGAPIADTEVDAETLAYTV